MKARRFLLAAVLSVVGCAFAFAGCGETVDGDHQHDYEWEITTPATCQQEGERKGTCKVCGNETTETLPRSAHTLEGEPTVITPSTCTTKGSGTQKCSVCGTEQPVELELAPHNMTHHEEVRATCQTDGSIEYWSCSECGLNYIDEKGTNVAASLVVTKETVPHQYDERGVCTVCGAHNPDVSQHICTPVKVNGVPADCKTEGLEEHYECKECGKLYKDAEGLEETTLEELKIDISTDHNAAANAVHYDEVESKSCLQYGKKERWDCKVCGRHFKDENLTQEYTEVGADGVCDENTLQTPKRNIHANANGTGTWKFYGDTNNEDSRLEPTCTSVGWKEGVYICEVCGLVFRTKEFDEKTNTLKEGTREDGTPFAPLNREDYVLAINPENHSKEPKKHNENRAAPTACGNDKVTYKVTCYECTYCGKFFSDENCKNEIDKEDVLNFGEHKQLEEENAVDSTCNTHGHPHCWTCKSCGEHFDTANPAAATEPLSAEAYELPYAPHVYTLVNSNSLGHWYSCEYCGLDETDEDGIIKMEDHIIEEGDDDECQICGYGGIDFVDFFTLEQQDDHAIITGFAKDDEGGIKFLSSTETVLRIPETDKLGLPITEIKNYALASSANKSYNPIYQKQVTKIYIPATITKIGYAAFAATWIDSIVTDIEFEPSKDYVEIGDATFDHFTGLKRVTLPTKMTRIPNELFSSCTALKTVNMPREVLNGGGFAKTFRNCESLESLDLWCLNGKSYAIGQQALQDCTSLKTIYLPKGLTELGAYCMQGCTSVEKIYWGGSEMDWNVVKKYDQDWNYNTPALMGDLIQQTVIECGYTHS